MMDQTVIGGTTTLNSSSNSSVIVQSNNQQQTHQQSSQQEEISTLNTQTQNQQTSSTIGGGLVSDSSSRLSQGATSATESPILSPQAKTYGKNFNGTMVVTSTPTNEAELQLYRVLQRASLLAYYDTLLEMGGDDVQQLCDAGEEEFLEIMALVGMASKPLHVRRLQKSLHEWVNNPSLFQTPLSNTDIPRNLYSPEPGSQTSMSRSPFTTSIATSSTSVQYTPLHHPITPTNPTTFNQLSSSSNPILPTSSSSSNVQLTPSLSDIQITRLTSAAERLVRTLPHYEPKQQNSKKRSGRELEQVMSMNESDPRRMDEIRKYAAIYGRFDCKRRPEKPLTLHEVCVNEAAAQICKYIPALLTRRDELFPHARQVVRDSGFGHSAGIARFSLTNQNMGRISNQQDDQEQSAASSSHQMLKRSRLSSDTSSDMSKDVDEPRSTSLLSIYQRVGRTFDNLTDTTSTKFIGYSKSDFDDADSRFSFSSSESPTQGGNGIDTDSPLMESPLNGKNDQSSHDHIMMMMNHSLRPKSPECSNPIGVQIISSSGGNIIAVANPALLLSPALSDSLTTVKREVISPDIR